MVWALGQLVFDATNMLVGHAPVRDRSVVGADLGTVGVDADDDADDRRPFPTAEPHAAANAATVGRKLDHVVERR